MPQPSNRRLVTEDKIANFVSADSKTHALQDEVRTALANNLKTSGTPEYAAINSAVAAAAKDVSGGSTAVQLRTDAGPDYSVSFDDGQPFVTATEADGITSKVKQLSALDASGARLETLTDDSGYSFAIVYEDPVTKVWNLQYGIRDDGSIYQNTGSTVPIAAGPDIVCVGDSLTQGAGANGNPWPSLLQTRLTALNKPRTVRNLGVGGEQSCDIAARYAGGTMLAMPAGGVWPASGSVNLTITNDDKTSTTSFLVQGNTGLNPCTIQGVSGTWTVIWNTTNSVYTATRVGTGTATTVNKPRPIVPAAAVDRASDILIIWVGRNNASNPDRIMSDIHTMIQHQRTARGGYLVVGVHNGAGEGTGTGVYTNITNLEAQMKKEFGRYFINQRRYMIDYGLADAGVSATTQDTADIAADIPPTSLRTDAVHYNSLSYPLIANLVADRLIETGQI